VDGPIISTHESASKFLAQVRGLLPAMQGEAGTADRDSRFPIASFASLKRIGLLMAPVPHALGGLGLCQGGDAHGLFRLLHLLGEGNLALGRIFEAHVNALELVWRHGSAAQASHTAEAVRNGHLFGLWVTDAPDRLRLRNDGGQLTLTGEKWFCSAAGIADRALVTADSAAGAQMLVVGITPERVVTDRGIRLAGMRAAATGSVDLTGISVDAATLIGGPGDYLREPSFSTGAWRSSAAALGGLAALIETARVELRARGRDGNPYQRMRFGQAVIAHETGRLWLAEAVARADAATGAGASAVAYVDLARIAVEAACLDAIRLIQRSLGLSAFMQGSAAERICRDLGVYLRQPAPDEALAEAAEHYLRDDFSGDA
jgi:alkylation response protein AidB-like acyl-CoA dehydrogenase